MESAEAYTGVWVLVWVGGWVGMCVYVGVLWLRLSELPATCLVGEEVQVS